MVLEETVNRHVTTGRLASLDVLRAGSGGRTNSLRHWDSERPGAGGPGGAMGRDPALRTFIVMLTLHELGADQLT